MFPKLCMKIFIAHKLMLGLFVCLFVLKKKDYLQINTEVTTWLSAHNKHVLKGLMLI